MTPDDVGFFVTSNPEAETKSVLEEKLADVDRHEVIFFLLTYQNILHTNIEAENPRKFEDILRTS